MHLSALWSNLIDPDVELDHSRRARVAARAWQTYSSDSVGHLVLGRSRRRWARLTYLALLAIAVVIVLILIGVRSDITMSMALLIFLGTVEALAGFPLVNWLRRPFLMEHVRRAILDLGYDEICWRCGYRLKNLPHEIVQCPECGAVRERPREIPAAERAVLDIVAPEPDDARGTMSHDSRLTNPSVDR